MNSYLINSPTSIEQIDFKHVNDDIRRYGDSFDYDGKSNYCVYTHVNKINGKMYIGISSTLKTRWASQGLGYKGCPKFYNAIQKYGWDGFDHIVLMNGLTPNMASEIEISLIAKYNLKENGYNQSRGGFARGECSSNTTAKTIHQYDLNGIYIQSFDSIVEAAKLVNNEQTLGLSGFRQHPYGYEYGFLWSEELVDQMLPYRPIMAEYLDEYHRPSRKSDRKILQINFSGKIVSKHNSVYELYDDWDQRYWLSCCLESKIKSHRYDGYIWIYEDEYDEGIVNGYINSQSTHKSVPIHMYDLDGNYIKTFKSSTSAQDYTGISAGSIIACCNKFNAKAGDFQFIYDGDTPPSRYEKRKRRSYPVCKIDINTGDILGTYKSLHEASKSLGDRDRSKFIKMTAEGHRDSTDGYIWRFIDSEGNIIEPSN